MKVALLTPGGVGRGGEADTIPCLVWLIEQLRAAGHDVHVFAARQEPRPGSWTLAGAPVSNAGSGPWQLQMLRSLMKAHREGRFAVIHAWWSSLGPVGAIASTMLRVPLVVTLPGGDLASLPDIGYGGRISWRGRLALRVASLAARRITVPSGFMRDMAERLGIRVAVVPFGVSLERWPLSAPRPRDPSQPLRLLHVASLNRVKDQRTLVRAMSHLEALGIAFSLRIVGVDTLGGEIQRLARELGLDDAVQFAGFLPHRELRAEYEQADLLVVSSRHDAGPMVVLEAALAGVATAGTCVGHIADQAPDAASAVPVGDAAALADAIRDLALDERRRIAMAAAAQAFALRNDASRTARLFESIYRDSIDSGACPGPTARQDSLGSDL